MPLLIAIQTGLPCVHIAQDGSKWRTGFYKEPVSGPLLVKQTGLAGDGQANLKYHGGPDRVALAYPVAHYDLWRAEFPALDLTYGAFGENFTVSDFAEDTTSLGDIFAIGPEVIVEVSQPRLPCANIGRRWSDPHLTRLVEKNGRTGWYLRVLTEGTISAGMPFVLIKRPFPAWTVSRAAQIMTHRHKERAAALELATCPALSGDWRAILAGS